MSITTIMDTFGVRATWNPELLVLVGLIGIAYFVYTGPQRDTFPDAQPVPVYKKGMFVIGLLLFYTAVGSPLNLIGHFMFSAHMFSQTLLYMVTPLFILIGLPRWMLEALIRPRWINRIMHLFTSPIPAVVLFNTMFSLYHVPFVLDLTKQNPAIHNLVHLVLLFLAFCMWIPVLSPIKKRDQLTDLKKIAYLFANGVMITPACALIIFSGSALYTTYTEGPQVLCAPFFSAPIDKSMFVNPLSPLEDQKLGGILMKLTQEFTYSGVLAYIFFRWIKREKGIDPLEPQPQG